MLKKRNQYVNVMHAYAKPKNKVSKAAEKKMYLQKYETDRPEKAVECLNRAKYSVDTVSNLESFYITN